MRVAVVSTPRSGNTWLRYLLANLYELEQHAVHHPCALDWSALSDRCIVQLHWHPTELFRNLLDAHGFRVVTIVRHPLDVLLSILHFCGNEPETLCWLQGEDGGETSIHRQLPTSQQFLNYATGDRAKALLSVSAEWRALPDVTCVRYEDLVRRTVETLETAALNLGPFKASPTEVTASLTLERLKHTAQNAHFWQGRPNLWKELLPADIAKTIAEVNESTFLKLGYSHHNLAPPGRSAAEERWLQIA